MGIVSNFSFSCVIYENGAAVSLLQHCNPSIYKGTNDTYVALVEYQFCLHLVNIMDYRGLENRRYFLIRISHTHTYNTVILYAEHC